MSAIYADQTTHVRIANETRDRINQFDDSMTQEETISLAMDFLEQSQD